MTTPTPEQRAAKIADAVDRYLGEEDRDVEMTANLAKDITAAIAEAVSAETEACAVAIDEAVREKCLRDIEARRDGKHEASYAYTMQAGTLATMAAVIRARQVPR